MYLLGTDTNLDEKRVLSKLRGVLKRKKQQTVSSEYRTVLSNCTEFNRNANTVAA